MAKNYPNYDDLVQMYQDGDITAVDFVTQQSDEITADRNSTNSAMAFMDYRADLFEESLSN